MIGESRLAWKSNSAAVLQDLHQGYHLINLLFYDNNNLFKKVADSFTEDITIDVLPEWKWFIQMWDCLSKCLIIALHHFHTIIFGGIPQFILAPLTGIGIGSIIPWDFFSNTKPGLKPFWCIKMGIILYTAGTGGCGAKYSLVSFTSSIVSKLVPSETSSIVGGCLLEWLP